MLKLLRCEKNLLFIDSNGKILKLAKPDFIIFDKSLIPFFVTGLKLQIFFDYINRDQLDVLLGDYPEIADYVNTLLSMIE